MFISRAVRRLLHGAVGALPGGLMAGRNQEVTTTQARASLQPSRSPASQQCWVEGNRGHRRTVQAMSRDLQGSDIGGWCQIHITDVANWIPMPRPLLPGIMTSALDLHARHRWHYWAKDQGNQETARKRRISRFSRSGVRIRRSKGRMSSRSLYIAAMPRMGGGGRPAVGVCFG